MSWGSLEALGKDLGRICKSEEVLVKFGVESMLTKNLRKPVDFVGSSMFIGF